MNVFTKKMRQEPCTIGLFANAKKIQSKKKKGELRRVRNHFKTYENDKPLATYTT